MQESGGDPKAINSKSGAAGLMQVMPDTVIKGRPSVAEITNDPVFAIRTGCQILFDYTEQYKSEKDGVWAYGGTNGTYADYTDIVYRVYDSIVAAAP